MVTKVAVKSGYYFEIFDKDDIPKSLINTSKKVKLNGISYELYKATTLEDEKMVNEIFGDRMGYFIDDYLEEEEFE